MARERTYSHVVCQLKPVMIHLNVPSSVMSLSNLPPIFLFLFLDFEKSFTRFSIIPIYK